MAKKKGNRVYITLSCGECKEQNYSTVKNRKNDSGRLTLNKFCKRCRKVTAHKEER